MDGTEKRVTRDGGKEEGREKGRRRVRTYIHITAKWEGGRQMGREEER